MAARAKKSATKPAKPKKPATKTLPPLPRDYVSNPFGLIRPSMRAIGVNIWLLIGLIVLGALTLVALFAAVLVGTVALSSNHGGAAAGAAGATILLIVFAILFLAPVIIMVLLASARRRRAQISWRMVLRFGPRMLGAGALTALATIIGLILLIIPGIIVATYLSLAFYAIVDEDLGVMDSLRRSRELVRGHVIEMWGLYGLNNCLSLVPLLGGLFSIVLTVLTLPAPAIRYLQLKELKAAAPDADASKTKPKIHWANYVVIVLVILGTAWGSYRSATQPSQPNSGSFSSQGVGTGTGY